MKCIRVRPKLANSEEPARHLAGREEGEESVPKRKLSTMTGRRGLKVTYSTDAKELTSEVKEIH